MSSRSRAFYERYGRVVLGRACVLLGDGDAAKDALQEVFLRVITSETHILEEPEPAAWLYRATTNLCLNRLRDEKRRKELLVERGQTGADRPGAATRDPESRAILLQILNLVPRDMQEIAAYRFVDEMTHDEIADLVGVSSRTVGNRLIALQQRIAGVVQRERAQ